MDWLLYFAIGIGFAYVVNRLLNGKGNPQKTWEGTKKDEGSQDGR